MTKYILLTKQEAINLAEQEGYHVFIAHEDDVSYIKTMDFNPKRINFEIRDNVVISASIG